MGGIKDKIVKWERPKEEWCKLNVDGCSLKNPGTAGVGGIIRDHNGDMQVPFSMPIGCHSNNYAEVMGLFYGLKHARRLGFDAIEIEMDSVLVIDWIKKRRCGLWYMDDFWEEIICFLNEASCSFKHCYRECNAAVDSMVKLGAKGETIFTSSATDLPMLTRGALRLDKLGLPYMRKQ